MSKRLSRRQRLKRDPSNQRWGKLIAWAKRRSHVIEGVCSPDSLCRIVPRVVWRKPFGQRYGRYYDRMAAPLDSEGT